MTGLDKGVARRPFSAIPDVGAFYPSQSAESARGRLFRTLDRGEGLAILFGETGLGKSLLLRVLASQFEINAPIIFPTNMRISGRKSFLRQILFQLRMTSSSQDEDELRLEFLNYLRSSDYSKFILLIDDVDCFPFSVLDEIKSLLDMESDGAPRFRIVLSGSARFEERLNHPRLAAFGQRIASRSWLDPFTRNETVDYLGRQMRRVEADYDGLAFSLEAAKQVHKLSEGVPRIINQIGDLSLYLSSNSDRLISEKTVAKAWALLQQIPEENVSEKTAEDSLKSSVVANDPLSDLPSASLPEESSSVIEFGCLSDEDSTDGVLNNDEISDSESVNGSVSLDKASVEPTETFEKDFSEENSKEEAEESLDEDEIIDQSGADLIYDQMIREKLLQSAPEGSPQSNAEPREEFSIPSSTSSDVIVDRKDRYLEELRLLELEVSQEADLIRKIRGMHTGLESFRMDGPEISSPGPRVEFEPNDSVTFSSDVSGLSEEEEISSQPEIPRDSLLKRPEKKRPFRNIFEKIYPEND